MKYAMVVLAGCWLAAALPVAAAPTPAQRSDAVSLTASGAASCRKLGDFYWEIGTAAGPAGSGAVGRGYAAQKEMHIASGSKWVFGSYVLEKIGAQAQPTPAQLDALEMRSGYTSLRYGRCIFASTVADCFERRGNDRLTPADIGSFYYNGGHDQKLAVDLGLGAMDNRLFAAEVNRYLGGGLQFGFSSPQPAGGMVSTPANYGQFLRLILSGRLRMAHFLGSHPVCTLPESCAAAAHSPVPRAWHYSLNHWVEDDPGGDGSFSSPGAFGFYPWISADRRWYGLLARESHRLKAAVDSVACGQLLRRAWMTGAAQQ